MAAALTNKDLLVFYTALAVMQVVEEDEKEEDSDIVQDVAVSLSLIYGVTRPREPGVHIQMYTETTVQCQCYNDSDFKGHFQLTRESFFKLLAAVENTGVVPTPENHLSGGKLPTDLEKQLLVTLWYTSNQCCIRDVADRFNI